MRTSDAQHPPRLCATRWYLLHSRAGGCVPDSECSAARSAAPTARRASADNPHNRACLTPLCLLQSPMTDSLSASFSTALLSIPTGLQSLTFNGANVYSAWGPANASGLVANTSIGAALKLYGYGQNPNTGVTGSLRFGVYTSAGSAQCVVTYTPTTNPIAAMVVDTNGYLRLFACTDNTCASPQTQVWNNAGPSPNGCLLSPSSCTSTCNVTCFGGAGPNGIPYVGSGGSLYMSGLLGQTYIFGSGTCGSGGVISPSPVSGGSVRRCLEHTVLLPSAPLSSVRF